MTLGSTGYRPTPPDPATVARPHGSIMEAEVAPLCDNCRGEGGMVMRFVSYSREGKHAQEWRHVRTGWTTCKDPRPAQET